MMNTFTSIFHEEVIKFQRPDNYMPKRTNDNKPKGKIIIKKSDLETNKNVDQNFLHTAAFGNKNDRKRLKRETAKKSIKESFLDFDII